MECPIPKKNIAELEVFVNLCKENPSILHMNELAFFRKYIESLGGRIPVSPTPKPEPKKESPPDTTTNSSSDMSEDEPESEVELDSSGVVAPDNDPPQAMGIESGEVSEEALEGSNEKKREAVQYYASGEYEKSTKAYTEAILLNPTSAILYAKRGQTLLAQDKPNACVSDCNKALQLNPDSAIAYKFRGRAYRLLGEFLRAAEDLRCACKLDFDEQADEWLKEVTPNARKLEEHNRKYERLRNERKIRQRTRAAQKARAKAPEQQQQQQQPSQQQQQQQPQQQPDFGGMQIPPEILKLMLEDPEILSAIRDPEVAAAFQDITTNPAKLFQYQNNPKFAKFLAKTSTLLSGKMGGGFPGFPEFGGAPGGGPARGPDSGPAPPADVDLD